MNNRYIYYDKSEYPRKKILEVIASDIITADEIFEKTFKVDPIRNPIVDVDIQVDIDLEICRK